MKLPNAERAVIAGEKLADYLLSPAHRVGKHKAAWFTAFGFSRAGWRELESALACHASENDVVARRDRPYGVEYIVEAPLRTPDRRDPIVRSVWLIRIGEEVPRFVTAFPGRRGT